MFISLSPKHSHLLSLDMQLVAINKPIYCFKQIESMFYCCFAMLRSTINKFGGQRQQVPSIPYAPVNTAVDNCK